MKPIATLLLLLAASSLAAQTKLVGFVKRQSSSNEVLPGVEVWCLGAKMTDLRYSNSKGYFELDFSAKKPGAVVREISATLQGYEVVNKDALKSRGLIEHPEDDPLIIVMCRQGEYRRAAAEYYQTIFSTGEAELQAEKKRLEALLEREQQQNALLLQQLANINAKLENLPQVAEAAADYFARIDLDQATEIQRTALKALENGNIPAALDAMPEDAMDKTMADAQKRKTQLESQLAETKQNIRQGIENYRFKARLYISLGDYPSAERLYEKALAADTSDLEQLYDYAVFLESIKRYEKALLWLEKVSTVAGAEAWRVANTQGLKGQVYQEIGRFPEAEEAYTRYSDRYAELYAKEPGNDFYKNGLAISYSKLGDIYQAQGKIDTALVYFVKETDLFEELYRDNPKSESLKNGLAISYEKLGDIYQAQGKIDTALVYFVKRSKLGEELYRDNPKSESLKNGLAISYEKLGSIYQAQGKIDTALVYFVKETDLFEELYRDNPKSESLKNGLAISYSKLGDIYQAQGKIDTALVYFVKETDLFEELYRDNPKSADLLFGLGVSYYKLSVVYEALGKAEEALAYLQKALPLFRRLHGITGLENHAQMADSLEREVRRLQSPAEANPLRAQITRLEHQVEAEQDPVRKAQLQQTLVSIIERLRAQQPNNDGIKAYTANAYGNLAWYRLQTQEFQSAEAAARKAVDMHPDAEWVFTNLALALLYQGKYKDAEALYKRFKGKPYNKNRSWTDVFLQDLDDLEALGIRHKDVDRARKMLRK